MVSPDWPRLLGGGPIGGLGETPPPPRANSKTELTPPTPPTLPTPPNQHIDSGRKSWSLVFTRVDKAAGQGRQGRGAVNPTMAGSRAEGHGDGGSGGDGGQGHADGKIHLDQTIVRKAQGAAAARAVDAHEAGITEPYASSSPAESASASLPASAPALPSEAGGGGAVEGNGTAEANRPTEPDSKDGSTRNAAPTTAVEGGGETKAG